MAQPIHCDADGEQHPADVLVSRLANGEVLAWCDAHYVTVCIAIAEAVSAAEAQASADEAVSRLAGLSDGAEPPTSGGSSAAGDPPAEPPTNAASGPAGPEPAVRTSKAPSGRPGASGSATGDPDAVADPA